MTIKSKTKNKLFLFNKFKELVSRAKKRLGKKQLIILLVVFLGIGIWRITAVRKSDWKLEISKVEKGQLTETIPASGEVVAEQSADLSFQTSGKLAWVGVKEGDWVVKGQAIASLDKKQLELRLEKYLNAWEREFTEFDDTNESVKDEVLIDSIRRIKERAQIDLDQTQIDVEIQNEVIRLATLTAPFSGIITEANSFPGANVMSSTAIYTIVSPYLLYFEAEVNEIDVTSLFKGQNVILRLDAYPNDKFEGKIEKIDFASTITSTGGTAYKVKVNLPTNKNLRFRLGMNGDAEFVVREVNDVLLMSVTALVEETEKYFVWTIEEKRAKKVEIEVGVSSFDEVEIISGLKKGDIIITRPPSKIEEGDKIAVIGKVN